MITIKKLEIITIKIPLVKPFVTSFGSITEREVILAKLFDESGEFGFGEAPVLSIPLYNPEIPDSVKGIVSKIIFPVIKDKSFETPEEFTKILEFIKGNEFAKSAVELAFYDLYGKITNQRLIDIIGGKKDKLLISATVSIHQNVKDAVKEAEGYIKEGITYIKLKTKPGFDIEHASAIKKAFPEAKLMLDANSSYIFNEETLKTYKELDKLDLYCIEQPLQSFDLIDHAKLQKEINTPIALDESIETLYDAEKAFEIGSSKLINIKIARVGGLTNSLAINEFCKKNDMKTWVGGMLETPIGFYANLALSTVENFDYPIDYLGALTYVEGYSDLFEKMPFEIKGEDLFLKIVKPGLGLELNWDNFNKKITETIVLE